MNFAKLYVVAALLPVFFLSACKVSEPHSGAYTVRIATDDGSGNYVFKNIDLETVTDLPHMVGSAATIKSKGTVTRNIVNGQTVSAFYHEGFTPSARFVKSSGVYIPSGPGSESLLMTTVMAHFEMLKRFFDELGATEGMVFPQKVLVEVTEEHVEGQGVSREVNNASYWPLLNVFIFEPGTINTLIPASMNSGIIAHEYFHSIFNSKVTLKNRSAKPEKLDQYDLQDDRVLSDISSQCGGYTPEKFGRWDPLVVEAANEFVLNSLNEGMADYFAYEYTGNPFWIGASLPHLKFRNLSKAKRLDCAEKAQANWLYANAAQENHSALYGVGSAFAHYLYRVSEVRKKNGQMQKTALEVIDFLSSLQQMYTRNEATDVMTPASLARAFAKDDALACKIAQEVFPGSCGK